MYIGIDLGTSSVKLLLLDHEGKVVKTVSKNYELLIPQNSWTEQNPNDWFNQTISGLKEITNGFEKLIKAISFSGQMHGMVLLDKNDQVIRNAILWNDQRTFKQTQYLNEVIGYEKLLEETGNIALTGLTAPKVLWVKENEPENFKKIDKIMLPKDYLVYKLTNQFITDVSDVSGTLYYDVKNGKYSQFMLDVLGINEKQLPKVYESFDCIGFLNKEVKRLLNLENDVKIIVGGGDQAVGAVGVGTVTPGRCSISLGTSGVVYVATEKFSVDDQSYLQSYRDATGNYHMMGVTLNAAGSLKWWSEQIFNDKNYNEFFNGIADTPIDDSLYYLPYLTGERAPINDPHAQGAFIGLNINHRRSHMNRALIEGVTYSLKQIFELVKKLGNQITTIRITGGGAKSPIWAQMISDIMNVEVETIKIEEGPALGAAILALVGSGSNKDIDSACKDIIKVDKIYQPKRENIEVYNKKYKKYETLYPVLKEVFNIYKKLDK